MNQTNTKGNTGTLISMFNTPFGQIQFGNIAEFLTLVRKKVIQLDKYYYTQSDGSGMYTKHEAILIRLPLHKITNEIADQIKQSHHAGGFEETIHTAAMESAYNSGVPDFAIETNTGYLILDSSTWELLLSYDEKGPKYGIVCYSPNKNINLNWRKT